MNCTSAIGMFEAPAPGASVAAPQGAPQAGASFIAILGEQTQAQADPQAGEMPICLFPTVDTGIDPVAPETIAAPLAISTEATAARPTKAFRREETENPENQGSDFSPIFVATQPIPAPMTPPAGSVSLYMAQEPEPAAPVAPESIYSQSASPARPTPQLETAGPSPIPENTSAADAVRPSLTFDIPHQDLDETPQPVQGAAVPPISKESGAAQPVSRRTVAAPAETATVPAAPGSAAPAGQMVDDVNEFPGTPFESGKTTSSGGQQAARHDARLPINFAAQWDRISSDAEAKAASPAEARIAVSSESEQAPRRGTAGPVSSAAQWDRMLSDAAAYAAPPDARRMTVSSDISHTAEPVPQTAPQGASGAAPVDGALEGTLPAANAPVQTETAPAPASQMITALDGVLTMANEQTTAVETKRTQMAVRGARERVEKPAAPAAARQEPASVVAPAAARAAQVDAPVRAEIVRMAPGVEMTQRIEALHTAQAAARPAVRSFTVPIGQETNPVATLRLVQMGTGVRMTVQTTDAALSQSMQTHLPQLVRGLEESGFRANFQPRTESTATMVPASTASADSRPMDSSEGGGSQHEGPAHGQSRERRQPSHEWRQWLQHGRKQNKEGR